MNVVVLAGGTGGAALAAGVAAVAPEADLTVIANTADDEEFWGLLVCPDVDAVIYRLAGVFDEARGFGIKGDTHHVIDALRAAGEDAWFTLGDRDLATHLVRTQLIRAGRSLTAATLELCRRFGVPASILPMTNMRVRTRFVTDRGELSFQEYFVRERLKPALRGITFAVDEPARPTPEIGAALSGADAVVIGPSNPLISINPILEVTRELIPRDRTIAVTPIVGGVALKGPTVEMMRAMGIDPSPIEVARMYADIASRFVLDERDGDLRERIEPLGYEVIVTDTVMRDGGRSLAGTLLRHV